MVPLQEDGGYTLRGGPVEALIAYAASSTKAGKAVYRIQCVMSPGMYTVMCMRVVNMVIP